jgi:hypothetical protein
LTLRGSEAPPRPTTFISIPLSWNIPPFHPNRSSQCPPTPCQPPPRHCDRQQHGRLPCIALRKEKEHTDTSKIWTSCPL